MNSCATKQGSALLEKWIRQPLTSIAKLNQRLDLVAFFCEHALIGTEVKQEAFRAVPLISRIARKCLKGKGSLLDVVKLYEVVSKLPALLELFTNSNPNTSFCEAIIQPLELLCQQFAEFREMVERSVDFEACTFHQYNIKPAFSEELTEIARLKEEIFKQISQEFSAAALLLEVEQGKRLKLERNPHSGYYMRLSRSDSHLVRERSEEFVELSTLKNGIHFTTQSMRLLSLSHDDLSRQYEKAQAELVQRLIEVTNSYFQLFEKTDSIVALLDVVICFSQLGQGAFSAYCRPLLVESEASFVLKGAAHPCLECSSSSASIICNDLLLNHAEQEFIVLTGPNMGGKSTFIKQAGLIAIMAQIGCLVPSVEAQVPIFDKILTRIGANDALKMGVSTFMLEMLESSNILRQATKNSLVIIDELGRGTSTKDGFGLAYAIAYELANVHHARTLFATHFHELAIDLAQQLPNVANYHVSAEASKDCLTFLYRVLPGCCERSFGCHVAEMCEFPQLVLDIARETSESLAK